MSLNHIWNTQRCYARSNQLICGTHGRFANNWTISNRNPLCSKAIWVYDLTLTVSSLTSLEGYKDVSEAIVKISINIDFFTLAQVPHLYHKSI
jgi:hypothetical protein